MSSVLSLFVAPELSVASALSVASDVSVAAESELIVEPELSIISELVASGPVVASELSAAPEVVGTSEEFVVSGFSVVWEGCSVLDDSSAAVVSVVGELPTVPLLSVGSALLVVPEGSSPPPVEVFSSSGNPSRSTTWAFTGEPSKLPELSAGLASSD